MPQVYRDQRNGQRQFMTAEIRVVWLITQGSKVQILFRYQGQEPFLEQRKGLYHVGKSKQHTRAVAADVFSACQCPGSLLSARPLATCAADSLS